MTYCSTLQPALTMVEAEHDRAKRYKSMRFAEAGFEK
jgi:hypothetical protein